MNTIIKKMSIFPLLGIFGISAAAVGAEDYRPASFGFDGAQLVSQMATISTGDHILYCRADVKANGQAENTHCFGKTLSSYTATSAEKAINDLPFSPAQVDGQSIPVRMSFRISLQESEGVTLAKMVPNLGTMTAKYGVTYVAPQERLDTSDWYTRYSKSSELNGEAFIDKGVNTRIGTLVKVNGRPEQVRVLDTASGFNKDSKKIESSIKRARFIPGMVNGKVVEMDYLVAVNYGQTEQVLAAK